MPHPESRAVTPAEPDSQTPAVTGAVTRAEPDRVTGGETDPGGAVPLAVYTDGACLRNPGPGGWAWAVPGGRFAAGPEAKTTNQRMEISAVLEALGALEGDVVVVSDSIYVVNCFRQRWWAGWEARGWRNSRGQPVANQDLWRPLLSLVHERDPGTVEFQWVKGHSGDRMNDLVDGLAVEAARTQAPREGRLG